MNGYYHLLFITQKSKQFPVFLFRFNKYDLRLPAYHFEFITSDLIWYFIFCHMNSFFYCCSCVMMIRQKENYLKHVYVNTVKYIVLTCFMAAIFSAKAISRIYNNVYSPMVMSHKYISYSLFDKFVANLIKFLNLFAWFDILFFINIRSDSRSKLCRFEAKKVSTPLFS